MNSIRLTTVCCAALLIASSMLIASAVQDEAMQTQQEQAGMDDATTQNDSGPTTQPAGDNADAETREGGVEVTTTRAADGMGDRQAQDGDVLVVHYTGKFQDGTVFDTSLKPRPGSRKPYGDPLIMKLGRGEVIRGWEIGLTGMKVGEQRTMTIPPAMAYGSSDRGPIPANSTLIFDVELVGLYRDAE